LGVQRLLAAHGIGCRIYQERRRAPRPSSFSYVRKDGSAVQYGSETGWDLRIAGRSIGIFAARIGFSLPSKSGKLARMLEHSSYNVKEDVRLVASEADGFELTYNLTETRNHSYIVNGLIVANCGEFVRPANTSCNLAS